LKKNCVLKIKERNLSYSFRKPIVLVIKLLSLMLISSNVRGQEILNQSCGFFSNRLYMGFFGGGGISASSRFNQNGLSNLFVKTKLQPSSAGIGGVHLGYQWPGFRVTDMVWALPNIELEGYYLGTTQSGEWSTILNWPHRNKHVTIANRVNSFPMNMGVLFLNGGLEFSDLTFYQFHLYFGGGLGASFVSISRAHFNQINLGERDMSHFDSKGNANEWAFAGQGKGGFSFDMTARLRVFAEYRFLYIAPTDYTFRSKKLPHHSPPIKRNIRFDRLIYNMGAAGFEFNV
jgi:hypothetical protein